MIGKVSFDGFPFIGIFCAANDHVAVVPTAAPRQFEKIVGKNLNVDVIRTNIANTALIGVFTCLNNEKILVPSIIEKDELKILKKSFSEVVVIDARYTTLGNLIAMNDRGVACSKYVADDLKGIIPAEKISIAGSDLVGSSIFVNNNGFLVHKDASAAEIKKLHHIFRVGGDVGTVNFGDPFVKTGIVANNHGMLVGRPTSGPELNRIDDIFYLNR